MAIGFGLWIVLERLLAANLLLLGCLDAVRQDFTPYVLKERLVLLSF